MSLYKAIFHLDQLLRDPYQSLLIQIPKLPSRTSTLSLFWKLHLPLALTLPLAALLAPYNHTLNKFPWDWQRPLTPLLLTFLFFIFAAVYDRVAEHAKPKLKAYDKNTTEPRTNIAFYLHLPVAGVGFFFLLHPMLGYAMLFLAELWALCHSLECLASLHHITRARSLTYAILALIFFLIPLLLIILLFSIVRTLNNIP